MSDAPLFPRVALIGFGLIGGSIARGAKAQGLAGEIVATDNGDPTDMTAFPSHDRKAFNGLALAIVRARRGRPGTITVTATSEGLAEAKVAISAK